MARDFFDSKSTRRVQGIFLYTDLQMRAHTEIEKRLRRPPRTSVIIEIDPITAARILDERNKGNRPPKPNKVQIFAGDMSNGRWGLTGDTIKFGTNGRLLDGQNRLAASVRSNRSFKTHVVFGIDPTLFGRMDVGKPRNPADVLHIAGFKYASTLAAAIRWAYLFDTDPYNRETLQPDFVLELARNKYSDIEPFIKAGREINRHFSHPAGQMAALIYNFSRSSPAKARDFLNAWLRGEQSGKYKIISSMQSLLYSQKSHNNGRIHELTRAGIIIKAWNLFKSGKSGSLNQLKQAGDTTIEEIS